MEPAQPHIFPFIFITHLDLQSAFKDLKLDLDFPQNTLKQGLVYTFFVSQSQLNDLFLSLLTAGQLLNKYLRSVDCLFFWFQTQFLCKKNERDYSDRGKKRNDIKRERDSRKQKQRKRSEKKDGEISAGVPVLLSNSCCSLIFIMNHYI